MNKEFIPYEQALALKELGFDEPCFGRYNVPGEFILSGCYSDSPLVSILVEQNDICEAHTLAPTFSQAFRWFREKYGILHDIDFGIGWGYGYIPIGTELELPTTFTEGLNTYEEAELECLKKLIEIVKSQKS